LFIAIPLPLLSFHTENSLWANTQQSQGDQNWNEKLHFFLRCAPERYGWPSSSPSWHWCVIVVDVVEPKSFSFQLFLQRLRANVTIIRRKKTKVSSTIRRHRVTRYANRLSTHRRV
jgi:hypothetical protein